MSIQSVTTSSAGMGPGAVSAASVALSQLGRSSMPLVEQAREAGIALAASLGRAGDPIATARLETAALDFGREVRALHLGNPDTPVTDRAAAVDAALALGEDCAAALSPVSFDAVDRVVTTLQTAAAALGETPAPPLYRPAADHEGA